MSLQVAKCKRVIGDPSYFQDKVKKVGQVSFILSHVSTTCSLSTKTCVWNEMQVITCTHCTCVALEKHRSHNSISYMYMYSVAKTHDPCQNAIIGNGSYFLLILSHSRMFFTHKIFL